MSAGGATPPHRWNVHAREFVSSEAASPIMEIDRDTLIFSPFQDSVACTGASTQYIFVYGKGDCGRGYEGLFVDAVGNNGTALGKEKQ